MSTSLFVAIGRLASLVIAYSIGYWRALAMRRLAVEAEQRPVAKERQTASHEDVPRQTVGACGVRGCPNQRPHSHALDLVRRLRETKR